MKTIFYVHGFASSSKGATVANLKQYLSGYIIIGLDYDSSKAFDFNLQSLKSQIDQANVDSFIIVGTSLGGLYAKNLADIFHVGCILINPVTDPATQLRQFLGHNTNFSTGIKFTFSEDVLNTYIPVYTTSNHCGMVVYSSKRDETLIDGLNNVKTHLNNCLLIPTNTKHRISSFDDLPDFKKHIEGLFDVMTCQLNI